MSARGDPPATLPHGARTPWGRIVSGITERGQKLYRIVDLRGDVTTVPAAIVEKVFPSENRN